MKQSLLCRKTLSSAPRRNITLALSLIFASCNMLIAQDGKKTQSRQLQEQTSAVSKWPGESKRWALVIGVDQYKDGNISPLKGAANDAKTLARSLTENAGFPPDQVILLATDQPEMRQPTRINILTYLSNLASSVPKDGLLLVSFSGHGLERGGQAFLIPSDARLTDDVSLLEETAVSVQRMHSRIRATGVSQVVILLDACRNDPGGRADAPNPLTAAYTRGFSFDVRNREVQAFATLYATAVGERAYEFQEKAQGYFTWAIVEGLKGAAANERGEVMLAALVKYVQDIVPKRIAIDLGANRKQYPFAIVEGYKADELVIGVTKPSGQKTSASLRTRQERSGRTLDLNGGANSENLNVRDNPANVSTDTPSVRRPINRPASTNVKTVAVTKVVRVTPTTGTLAVAAMPGATVLVEPLRRGESQEGTIDKGEGIFIFNDLKPGRYRVAAELEGYEAVEEEVTVVVNRSIPVTLYLRPITFDVSINTNIKSGRIIYGSTAETQRIVIINDGRVVLTGLRSGNYEMEIEPDDNGYEILRATFRLPGKTDFDIELKRIN